MVMLGIVGGTLALVAVVSLAMMFRRWKLNEEEKALNVPLYSPFDDGQFALDATMGMPGWGAEPYMMPGAPDISPTMPYPPMPGLYPSDSFQPMPPVAQDGIWPAPADPTLEAMRRQAQNGLWVEPTPRDGSV